VERTHEGEENGSKIEIFADSGVTSYKRAVAFSQSLIDDKIGEDHMIFGDHNNGVAACR
jgi:hypothetical protein